LFHSAPFKPYEREWLSEFLCTRAFWTVASIHCAGILAARIVFNSGKVIAFSAGATFGGAPNVFTEIGGENAQGPLG
jgi:hypothetical protein